MKRADPAIKRKYTTITIPTPLFAKIQEIIKDTGFSSASDYVTYIMREMVSEVQASKKQSARGSRAEGEVIKKLRALGYV
ncbi:MAG: ribbon-helix-helix domain-containing protein [Candidatus Micrarchaeales archaeon]|nr:ribbon-helix-helix domain-containing protein [Candidatus Micrarchaeales archaeon]